MPKSKASGNELTLLLVTANDNERDALLKDKAFSFSAPQPSPLAKDSTSYNIGRISAHTVIHFKLPTQGSAKSGASHTSISRAIEAWEPDAVVLVGIAFGKENSLSVMFLFQTVLRIMKAGKLKMRV